jgi:signal peptide peptidase SppA
MRYAHVLGYVASTLWSIAPAKMQEILGVLAFRAAGHEFTPDEIAARIGDRPSPAPVPSGRQVGVIPVRGVIAHRMGAMDQSSGGASCESISDQVATMAASDDVSTIIYDIDSPGGTVPGVQELAAQMFALRGLKRQVAMVNGMACSAAYWLASQCDEIVSIPSGTAGSIGVFSAHQDVSAALEREGIKMTLISAGKHKVEGNPFEPLSDEARAVVQGRVDGAYAQFLKDVARGRGVTSAEVRDGYGEGRALGATDAKAAGLIDRIDTWDDTIARLVGRRRSATNAMRSHADDIARLRVL